MNLSTISLARIVSWMGVVICFMLPFCRGCDNAPVIPAEIAFKNPQIFIMAGLPFLYPLILLLGKGLQFILGKKDNITQLFYTLNLILISGLSTLALYFTFAERKTKGLEDPINVAVLIAILIVLGLGVFGFISRTINKLLTAAFLQSALSFIWISANLLWNKDPLYGGWLALGFSFLAVLLSCPFKKI